MTETKHTNQTFTPTDVEIVQDRYRSLFERSPEAVIVTTITGEILDFNSAALDFFDISRSEIKNANILSFYANRADREALIRQADETGLVHDTPVIFVDNQSRIKHTRVTTMRLDDPDGNVYGYQSVIRDVTKQRMAEKKLHSQKNYAEQLIDIAPDTKQNTLSL